MSYAYDADKNKLQNEIKKALYREKPIANCTHNGQYVFMYECKVTTLFDNPYTVKFTVPISDMGDATFGRQMHGQLLIRWIEL